MKKIISLLLTLIMVFSLATVAFAEGETTTNTDTNQKVVGLASENLLFYAHCKYLPYFSFILKFNLGFSRMNVYVNCCWIYVEIDKICRSLFRF